MLTRRYDPVGRGESGASGGEEWVGGGLLARANESALEETCFDISD